MKKILLSLCVLSLLCLSPSNAMSPNHKNSDRKSPVPQAYKSLCTCHAHKQPLILDEAYTEAIYHFIIKNYEQAHEQLLAIMSNNYHVGACYHLALMYFYGYGCQKNNTRALEYCTIAQAHNITGAQELFIKITNYQPCSE